MAGGDFWQRESASPSSQAELLTQRLPIVRIHSRQPFGASQRPPSPHLKPEGQSASPTQVGTQNLDGASSWTAQTPEAQSASTAQAAQVAPAPPLEGAQSPFVTSQAPPAPQADASSTVQT